jgi:hypothetical protein
MHVPHLRPAGPEPFPGGLLSALDEPGIRREFLHAVKARDVVNLVEDGQGQDLANAWDRAEPVKGVAIVLLGLADDRQFQVVDERVVLVDEYHVHVDALAHTWVGKVVDDAVAIARVRQALLEGRQIVLSARVLNVGQELPALPDEMQASAQQIARRPRRGRICVGLRQHAAAQQHGDLVRVDPVVLGLAAVNGLHRQRVAQHEREAFSRADVRQPIPREHALDGDDQTLVRSVHRVAAKAPPT